MFCVRTACGNPKVRTKSQYSTEQKLGVEYTPLLKGNVQCTVQCMVQCTVQCSVYGTVYGPVYYKVYVNLY